MATAKMHKGQAIVAYNAQGKAVDSEGKVIDGAPKAPKSTDPSQQAGAVGGLTTEERIGIAIAQALANPQALLAKHAAAEAAASVAASDEEDEGTSDSEEEEGLPTLAELPSHLDEMTDADEIKSMQKQDKRKGAKPLYKARLAAIAAE